MSNRVAIIACAVGLPGEKGYSRFPYLSNLLCNKGYTVDLYTSTFNHWEKAQRDENKVREIQENVPYKIILAHEPGYKKNIDIRRIFSHRRLAKNIVQSLERNHKKTPYDLLYVIIPDNRLAADVVRFGKENEICTIVDIEDLWPEGMEQMFHIPKIVGSVLFASLIRNAKTAYHYADAYVGTSDEFRDEPLKYGEGKEKDRITVYVGCDLHIFDKGVSRYSDTIEKGEEEFWIIYTGTLGSSYDIGTLVKAAQDIKKKGYSNIKFKILGNGPLKEQFESMARKSPCEVEFLGYVQYEKMAAYLSKSDVTINSFIKAAPQSIVNKVGDYLAAGKPMINTLSSPEFKRKVETEKFGINVEAENETALSEAILQLYKDRFNYKKFCINARKTAEYQFDRTTSYQRIAELIEKVILDKG